MQLRQGALEPLRAEAQRQQILIAAFGAGPGHRLGVTAVMAAQRSLGAMDDQPRGAARALRLPTAPRTEERGRESAPVDEQQRLLAPADALGDGGAQPWAHALVSVRAPVGNEAHRRHGRSRTGAAWEQEASVAPASRGRVALQGRRRTAQDDRHVAQSRTIDRNVSRVVAHAVLLLERPVVLLVDDDQAEPRQRREDRQSCAHDELRIASGSGEPMVEPLGRRQRAVQNRDARSRQRHSNALLKLRRQIDLGYEQQRLPARADDACCSREVDLGLPAPGHALQQRGCELARSG